MSDGKIVIDIMMDDGSVQKGVANLDKSLRGLDKAGEKGSLGIGKIVASLGIMKLASSAIGMIKGSIDSAFGRIDTMESFQRVMTAISGDANIASQTLEQLKVVTKGTAYGLDTAAKAVQGFVTRGVEIPTATKYFEAFGNAVSFYGDGSKEQLENVTDALGKMLSKGKVEMSQMDRLTDAGIDGVGTYAKATGRSVESVQKDLSSGAISSKDFVDTVSTAFEEGTNGVLKIAGASKEAGATWRAVFTNMKAAVTRGVVGIIQAIDDGLKAINLPSMRAMIASVGTAFETVLGKIAIVIPRTIKIIGSFIKSLNPIVPVLKIVGIAASTFVAGMVAMSVIQQVSKYFDLFKTSLGALKTVMLAHPLLLFASIAVGIVVALIKIFNKTEMVKNAFSSLGKIVKNVVSVIQKGFGTILKGLKELASGNIKEAAVTLEKILPKSVVDGVIKGVQAIRSAFSTTVSFLKSVFDKIKPIVINVFKFIWDYWKEVGEGFKNIFGAIPGVFNSIITKVTPIFNKLKPIVSNVFNSVAETMGKVPEKVRSIFNALPDIFNSIVNKVTPIINKLKPILFGVFNSVSEIMGKIPEKVRTIFNALPGIYQSTVAKIQPIMEKISTIVSGVADKVKPILQEIPSAASNAFVTMKGVFKTSFDTIKSVFETLKPVASNVFGSLVESAKEVPSKVGEVFRTTVDIIKGVFETVRPIFDTIKDVALDVFLSIKDSISDVFNGGGADFSIFTTIISFILPLGSAFTMVIQVVKNILPEIMDTFGQILNIVVPVVQSVIEIIGELAKQVIPMLVTAFETITPIVSSVISVVSSTIANLLPIIVNIVDAVVSVFSTLAPVIMNVITAILPVIFNIFNTIMPFIGKLIGLIGKMVAKIAPFISMLISSAVPVIKTIASVIANVINAALPIVIGLVNMIMAGIKMLMPVIMTIATIVTEVVATIIAVVSTIFSVVMSVLNPIIAFIGAMITIIIAIVSPIITFIAGVMSSIFAFISPIIAFISGVISTAVSVFGSIFRGILTIVSSVFSGVSSFISGTINTISSIVGTLSGVFSSIFNTIFKTVSGVMQSVGDFISGIFDNIKSAWDGLTNFVSTIFGGIESSVKSLVDNVKGFVNGVIGGINGAIGLINKIPGVNIGLIPQLARGTKDFQGGFARINEGGRGELVMLPSGAQVFPHDVSVRYAKESAKRNADNFKGFSLPKKNLESSIKVSGASRYPEKTRKTKVIEEQKKDAPVFNNTFYVNQEVDERELARQQMLQNRRIAFDLL